MRSLRVVFAGVAIGAFGLTQLAADAREQFELRVSKQLIPEAGPMAICLLMTGKEAYSFLPPANWRIEADKEERKVSLIAPDRTVDVVGRRWGHCARSAGWGLISQIHALGDGAEWIRLQTREVFGRQGNFLCDFFHVSEYLGAAAQSCRATAPDRWRQTQQARLKRGALEKVIEALAEHLEPPATPEEEAPVRNGHRYLTNRSDCLDYPR